jgi:hypothetical protein
MPQRASGVRNTQAPPGVRANVTRSPLGSGNGSGTNAPAFGSDGSWALKSTSRSRACEASSTPISQSLRQHAPEFWQVKTTPSGSSSGRSGPCIWVL